MSSKISRSTSFLSINGELSLGKVLQKARKTKKKFVVVSLRTGTDEPAIYLAEHKRFVDALDRVKKGAEGRRTKQGPDIEDVKKRLKLSLQSILESQQAVSKSAETTEDSHSDLSERTRSAIRKGTVVVHLRNDKASSIFLPKSIAFNKWNSRGWLNLTRFTGESFATKFQETEEKPEAPLLDEHPPEEIVYELTTTGGEGAQAPHGEAPGSDLSSSEAPRNGTLEVGHGVPPSPAKGGGTGGGTGGRGGGAAGDGGGGEGPGGGGDDGGAAGGVPPGGDLPAYPEIIVSEEHPVQSSKIDIDVAITFKKPLKTRGNIKMPVDTNRYILDVHLLLGQESRWSQLIFQRPKGTLQSARFEGVRVPSLPEGDQFGDKRLPYDIYVSFYFSNSGTSSDPLPVRSSRWCGEAVTRIEILPRPGMAPTPITPPENVEWRKHLNLSLTAPPPDLLVRIHKVDEREFQWTVLSPHQDFKTIDPKDLHCKLSDAPYNFVQDNFEKFAGTALTDDQISRLEDACELVYAATPAGFRKAYWDLRLGTGQEAGKRVPLETIQFISDEPYIPWELMRVSDDDRAPDEEPEILAVRHAVGRWIAPESLELRDSLPVSSIAVFASSYESVPRVKTKLKWAVKERETLHDDFNAVPHDLIDSVVRDFLKKGEAQVIHFSCHGRMNVQLPEQAVIELEDADLFATRVWSVATRRGIGRQRPLVFLNACQTAAAGELLGFVFGWPQAFLRMGATACIAPLWSVIDESAKDAATDFYGMVLKAADNGSISLGEALRAIRSRWKDKKSLTYLGYVLYGDPTATLKWQVAPKPKTQ
jgi:hypothetical protein